jgi:hypothetical protein
VARSLSLQTEVGARFSAIAQDEKFAKPVGYAKVSKDGRIAMRLYY